MSGVCLLGPAANHFVLEAQQEIFSASAGWKFSVGALFRNGLLSREGANHRKHRSIMQAAFTRSAVDSYLENACASLDRFLRAEPFSDKVCAYHTGQQLTSDMVTQCLFGIPPGDELRWFNQRLSEILASSLSLVRLTIPGPNYHKALRSRRMLEKYGQELIAKRRQKGGLDMLSRLCHARNKHGEMLSAVEVVDHLIFISKAAQDTTAATLASILYELALHPDWQERLRTQSRRLPPKTTPRSDTGLVFAEHQLVVKEALRLHTPIKLLPRLACEDFGYGGYDFPRGTQVVLFPAYTHLMPEVWSEPMRFDPERFAEPRLEHQQQALAYLPFGHGVHACLGQVFAERFAVLILHKMLRRYRWTLAKRQDRLHFQQVPIRSPKGRLLIKFESLH